MFNYHRCTVQTWRLSMLNTQKHATPTRTLESTFKYFIILIVSTYYILCISWIIKCLITDNIAMFYLHRRLSNHWNTILTFELLEYLLFSALFVSYSALMCVRTGTSEGFLLNTEMDLGFLYSFFGLFHGVWISYAEESYKRKDKIFRTRQKFEIKDLLLILCKLDSASLW